MVIPNLNKILKLNRELRNYKPEAKRLKTTDPNLNSEQESNIVIDTGSDSEQEANIVIDTDSEQGSIIVTDTDSDLEQGSNSVTDTDSDSTLEPEPVLKPSPRPTPPNPSPKPQPEPVIKPSPRPRPTPPNPSPKPQPEPVIMPSPRPTPPNPSPKPTPKPEPEPDFIRKKKSLARLKALPKTVQMAIEFIRKSCKDESVTTPGFFGPKPSPEAMKEFKRKLRTKSANLPNMDNFNIAVAIFKEHLDSNLRVLPIYSDLFKKTEELTWPRLKDKMSDADFEKLWFTFEAISVLLSKYSNKDYGSDQLTKHLRKSLTNDTTKRDYIPGALKKLILTFQPDSTQIYVRTNPSKFI